MLTHPLLTRFLIILTTILAIWGLFLDVRNTSKGGSVDLRNRVTGARVAAEDMDPFTYKWSPDEKPEFCDPFNHAGWPYSKTTVSPVVLAIHDPFINWNYKYIQWFWFFLQYACLAGGLVAWSRGASKTQMAWGTIFTLAICSSSIWRFHVDHGQMHVLFAALLLGVAWLDRGKDQTRQFSTGLAGSFLFGMRPVFFGQFAPPLHSKRWIPFAGVAVGLLLMFFLPRILCGSDIWEHYRSGMEGHARLYLEQAKPVRTPMPYPGSIEGIPIDQLARFARIPFADTSVFNLISFKLPSKALLGTWAALMLVSGIVMLRRPQTSKATLWWAITAWIVIGDFLLPAFRNTYNDILFWPMLLFGLRALKDRALTIWVGICSFWLLTALAVWIMPKSFIPVPSVLGGLIGLGVVVWTLLPTRYIPPKLRPSP